MSRTHVTIDLNVRVRGNDTYAGFEDVSGPIRPGMEVEVREPESGLVGPGRITDIDADNKLVYLSVDWHLLHSLTASPASPATVAGPGFVVGGVDPIPWVMYVGPLTGGALGCGVASVLAQTPAAIVSPCTAIEIDYQHPALCES